MSAGRSSQRLGLLLGRLDVVVDVVEVDAGDVAAPGRQRAREEVVERAVAELPHPVGLVLVLGDRLDELVRQAAARLEEVVLRRRRIRGSRTSRRSRSRSRWTISFSSSICVIRPRSAASVPTGSAAVLGVPFLVPELLQLIRELGAAGLHDLPVDEDVDVVRLDVVEDPLVVRDHERAHVRADELAGRRRRRPSARRCRDRSRSRRAPPSAASASPSAGSRPASSRRPRTRRSGSARRARARPSAGPSARRAPRGTP